MSNTVVYWCDRCGRKGADAGSLFHYTLSMSKESDWLSPEEQKPEHVWSGDLCMQCFPEFVKYMDETLAKFNKKMKVTVTEEK